MIVRLWGTRGSLGAASQSTVVYGGDTSAVEVRAVDGSLLVLDAGSGVRRLGLEAAGLRRVDILLTHLHMDHIQGLGFFAPLFDDGAEVHIWGPRPRASSLFADLTRYLSPPLFPVRLRDLPRVKIHEVAPGAFEIGPFSVEADLVCHPGSTLGYRVTADGSSLAYLPDHEPALGVRRFPDSPDWTSGYAIAAGADLLIHDAQYTLEEYQSHVGWGHSAIEHAVAFAAFVGARHLCTFHHDPAHTDEMRERMEREARHKVAEVFLFTSGIEGTTFDLDSQHRLSR